MMNVAARMLTPEFLQVNGYVIRSNADPMIQANNDKPGAPVILFESIVNTLIARMGPQRLLVISARPDLLPDIDESRSRLVARVDAGGVRTSSGLRCEIDALPFQDGAFNMLIMHHVISDGLRGELDEAQRVLTGNGQLLVVGRGRYGMTVKGESQGIPVLSVRLICSELKQRAFLVQQCEGLGFRQRNIHLRKKWQRVALPFSDLVLIRGRHTRQKPVVTPLKFSQPQVAGVRSAVHEGLSREAV